MTLEELREKWPWVNFELCRPPFPTGAGVWIEAYMGGSDCRPCIEGCSEQDESAACEAFDRWMTKHIKRPRSRKGAKGAKESS